MPRLTLLCSYSAVVFTVTGAPASFSLPEMKKNATSVFLSASLTLMNSRTEANLMDEQTRESIPVSNRQDQINNKLSRLAGAEPHALGAIIESPPSTFHLEASACILASRDLLLCIVCHRLDGLSDS